MHGTTTRILNLVFYTFLSRTHFTYHLSLDFKIQKGKGKTVPLQAWREPEGSRRFTLPDFMTTAQDGGKVDSLTNRPPLRPGNVPGAYFH